MQIQIQEIKADHIVESGIYVDLILSKKEINELMEGELLEGCGGLKDKKIFFGIGLQGFYGQKE